MEEKSRCIVLRTVRYGDSKIIADLLCRECGRVSVAVTIEGGAAARSRRGGAQKRMGRQLFQPLSVLDAVISMTPNRPMARLGEARLAVPYASIPFDGAKMSLAFFVAEFLGYSTRSMHCDPLLYDFVEQSLQWLDAAERGIGNFHLMFMMRMARFLGFLPDLETYMPGAVFNLREGVFSLSAPCHPDFLVPQDAEHIIMLMRMRPGNIHLFRLTREERNRITDICLRFYRLHVPVFGEMRTLDVLRAL